ncbi:MAG: hypothetical protein RLZZ126_1117 [Pseudomonadota bacterium]|jgi:50S ribosomal protein L16 3-hydroxylase
MALLGGLSAAQFMRRHWQKRPLLIRQAIPGITPPLTRAALFELAAHDDVESRLVRRSQAVRSPWSMRRGPFARRALPAIKARDWTLLVQGVDLHHDGARAVLDLFRFLPDARLDDLMISYATPGGGVGPHFDSYDVFLLQVQGTRRWRIGRQRDLSLQEGAPLKILQNFAPQAEYDLQPGDMLYLPPRWAHDGLALDECMTCSIGFRAPSRAELQRELLVRLADQVEVDSPSGMRLYQDPRQSATTRAAEIPENLLLFSEQMVFDWIRNPTSLSLSLGEYLTEPKANTWFDPRPEAMNAVAWRALPAAAELRLDRRSRMMFRGDHLFVNGESFRLRGADARILHDLANKRIMAVGGLRRLSSGAREALLDWINAGWLHV